MLGAVFFTIFFWILLILSILIFVIVCNWKLFEKAGKEGYFSIIPIYNKVVLFEIIGYKWYYIFFLLLGVVPIVGQVMLLLFTVSYNIKLAKSFGQPISFGIGLWLVNPIFIAIIAFDKSINYNGKVVDGDIGFNDLF